MVHPVLGRLYVRYLQGFGPGVLTVPRYYTLTHSDKTGELFLTIGPNYDLKQISGLYTRFIRDEVLAALMASADGLRLEIYCHVSGGFVFGRAGWRYSIFRDELPLVLEAIRYGDREFFGNNTDLDRTPIFVCFRSSDSKYNKCERWGIIADYRI